MRSDLPDLQLLEAFTVLVDEGSVTRAAHRLGLSQPATSHCLARLRRTFDDPLLVRSNGRLMPTQRAMELVPEVAALLAGARRLAAAHEPFDPAASRLTMRLLAPAYIGSLLSVPLAVHLDRQAPGIAVDFIGTGADGGGDRLGSGEADFQLGWWEQPPPQLQSRSLFSEEIVCMTSGRDARFRDGIDLDAFLAARHGRIHQVDKSFTTNTVDRAVEEMGARLSVVLHAPNPFVLAAAVAETSLVATISRRLAARLAALFDIRILPLPFEAPKLRVALYWHQRTHAQASHRWFRSVIAGVARTL